MSSLSALALQRLADDLLVHRIALQLHILASSESMGDHDSEIMGDRGLDRGDA